MKHLLFLPVLAGLLVSCSATQPAAPETTADLTGRLLAYQDLISTDFLKIHLFAIAADSMEGRDTGSEGIRKAEEYIAQQYTEMGLTPIGAGNTYFQPFELSARQQDSTVFELFSRESMERTGRFTESTVSSGPFIRAFGGLDTLSGDIVFAGFGVNDPDRGVAHLSGIDLKGKWVLVFQDIPYVVDGDTLVSPSFTANTRFGTILNRGGAKGILIIPEVSSREFGEVAREQQQNYGNPSGMSLKYLESSSGDGFRAGYSVVSPEMAARLLGLNGEDELWSRRDTLIKSITAFSPSVTSYRFTQTPHFAEVTIDANNIVAFIEGSDPVLKEEVVVLTAHHDHVGIGRPDSTGDRIYNGADDDGSGTVALMSVAQTLAEAKKDGLAPRRSVLILHVSGEEKGLLGSRYYSDHPLIPIENTVANLNIDMIGRIDEAHEKQGVEEYAYIIGAEIISSGMDSLLKAANRRSGQIELDKSYNNLKDPNQFYRRSDHWNFGRLGVPFAFFFTGVHEDYHRPGDEVHKISFEKMAKIVRTIYASTVLIANAEERPLVDNEAFIEITKGR